jgi:VWFA-related protein
MPPGSEGRIHLDVLVTDKSGKPVTGLDAKDFTLLDNGHPGKVLSFRAFEGSPAKPNPPVEVILLIDTVNLPFSRVAVERQLIEKFLRENGGHLAQPVSIYILTNEGVEGQTQPAVDGNALAGAFDRVDRRLRTIGRGTGAWGAIERFEQALQTISAIAEEGAKMPRRKLLIWVGPGWPMLSGMNIQTSTKGQRRLFDSIVGVSTKLREARIAVYSVSLEDFSSSAKPFYYEDFLKGVKTAEKAIAPDLGLKVLAVQSGGRAMVPSNDLAGQIDACVQDAGAYYTISFDPPRADRANEYHDLKVLIGKPGLSARTNTGYYNQP